MKAIVVNNLKKDYRDLTAVDKISFEVEQGEIFGVLGPNGAGKTTTINMLSTIIPPTSGNATVAGYDIIHEREKVRENIGIVFQEPAIDDWLTGRENLEFHAMMYNIDKETREKRISEALKSVNLEDNADKLMSSYSGGMKRKLEIIRALISRPRVLFLDEPTVGLDTQTRRNIWEDIQKLNKTTNVSVILTTHYIQEADALCDRVAIFNHGKIIAIDTPQKLKDLLGGDVISLKIRNDPEELIKNLKKSRWIKKIKLHDSHVDLTVKHGEQLIPKVMLIANKSKVDIESVNLHKPSLEDVFIHLTGKNIKEHEATRKEQLKNKLRRRHELHRH